MDEMSKEESKYKIEIDWTRQYKSVFSQEDNEFMVEFLEYFNKELKSGNYSDLVYIHNKERCSPVPAGVFAVLTEKNFNDIRQRWEIIKKNAEENSEIIREVIKFLQK